MAHAALLKLPLIQYIVVFPATAETICSASGGAASQHQGGMRRFPRPGHSVKLLSEEV